MNEATVKQVMTHLVVTVSPEETIHEAAVKLSVNGISGAPVVQEGDVIGMVSESDIIHAVAPASKDRHRSILELVVNTRNRKPLHASWGPLVRDVMSSGVVFQVSAEASIWEAASLIERRGIKRLPVVNSQGRLVGIVSRADIIRAIGRSDSAIRSDVIETIAILGLETFEDLEVIVNQGIATLRGEADRKSTKRIVTRLARNVPGVIQVIDELNVRESDPEVRLDLSASDFEILNPFGGVRERR